MVLVVWVSNAIFSPFHYVLRPISLIEIKDINKQKRLLMFLMLLKAFTSATALASHNSYPLYPYVYRTIPLRLSHYTLTFIALYPYVYRTVTYVDA